MSFLTRWWSTRRLAIVQSLARIEQRLINMAGTLDDVKANQAKERAVIEKLLAMVKGAPAGTFTDAQQTEIDAIIADQETTLAEGDGTSSPATPTPGA